MAILLVCFACSEESGVSERGFLRVLDDRDISVSYNPVSILTRADSGYIILTEKKVAADELPLAVILNVDEDGNFVSSDSLDVAFRQPIQNLVPIGTNYYFIAMQAADYQAALVTVDDQGSISSTSLLGIGFPLASSRINDQLLLLSYDAANTNMRIGLVNTDGTLGNSGAYTIGAGSDIQQRVLDHFFESDQKLPFFTGVSPSGNYFFNGIYNFTFSLVFTNLGAAPSGVVQGQGDFGGISAYLPQPTGGALVGFQYEENFFDINATISETAITSSINFFTDDIPELGVKANAKIVDIDINGSNYLVIVSETEGRQVILYFYEASTGNLTAIDYIGYINPYTFGDIQVTENNELIIVGSFFANGRFKRPFVKKFSSQELTQIVSR